MKWILVVFFATIIAISFGVTYLAHIPSIKSISEQIDTPTVHKNE